MTMLAWQLGVGVAVPPVMRLTLHTKFRRMTEVVAEKWTKLGGGPLVHVYQVSAGCIARPRGVKLSNRGPHPREPCVGMANMGRPWPFRGLLWLEMGNRCCQVSSRPGSVPARENLGRGEAQQIGVPNKSHSADLCSGPCSSWGTGRKKIGPGNRTMLCQHRIMAIRHLTGFPISDGRRLTWHHDLSIPWENSQQTRR